MTDEQVMSRICDGHLNEAGILYDRYQRLLYNYFLRLLFNRETSMDLTQNVFLRLIRYHNTYRKGSSFRPWIFTIARNEYHDYLKKEGKYRSNSTDLEEINRASSMVLEGNETAEQVRILHKALTMISEEQREVLLLSRYMKMKNAEIACILNSNENAVKGKIFRALQKLKEAYFKIENG